MISKQEEAVLAVAIANERVASEIVARVIDATPANIGEAQALLDVIKPSKKETKEIEEYLVVSLAYRKYGKEIADQLDLIVQCLEAQVLGVAGNAALNAAQAKLKPLSKEAKEIMVIAITSRSISKSITSQIDIATAQAFSIIDAV